MSEPDLISKFCWLFFHMPRSAGLVLDMRCYTKCDIVESLVDSINGVVFAARAVGLKHICVVCFSYFLIYIYIYAVCLAFISLDMLIGIKISGILI